MKCKWNEDRREYVTEDGDACKRDEYGDPTRHCASRRCSLHVGLDEVTCPRCVNRARRDIRWLANHAPLLDEAALEQGANSTAADLAGPAADYATFSARRLIDKRWIIDHLPAGNWERAMRALLEDDDNMHPYTVTTRWHHMLATDYEHALPDRFTTLGSTEYLDRNLNRIAQDPEQEFDLLARELHKSREAVESALSLRPSPERGAPCPECTSEEAGVGPRLQREHPHWCEDPDCERIHYSVVVNRETGELVPDTTGDRWVCPRDRERHWWSHADYEKWIEDRRAS